MVAALEAGGRCKLERGEVGVQCFSASRSFQPKSWEVQGVRRWRGSLSELLIGAGARLVRPTHPTRDPNSGTYQPTYGYSDGNFSSTLAKMLYLVGLGLSDETDITVKGLDVVKRASRVYLEAYTSILLVDQAVLVR